jgi:hypothetical protein
MSIDKGNIVIYSAYIGGYLENVLKLSRYGSYLNLLVGSSVLWCCCVGPKWPLLRMIGGALRNCGPEDTH